MEDTTVGDYPRASSHTSSISRRLRSMGSDLYIPGDFGQLGFRARQYSDRPVVALVEIEGLEEHFHGSRDKRRAKRSQMLAKIREDALADGYFVAWAWDEDEIPDTTRLLVSGYPIKTPYVIGAADAKPEPIPPAVPKTELGPDVTAGVFNLLTMAGCIAATPHNPGFVLSDWNKPGDAVMVTYSTEVEGYLSAPGRTLKDGRLAMLRYAEALTAKVPTLMLAGADPFTTLVVARTWGKLHDVVLEVKAYDDLADSIVAEGGREYQDFPDEQDGGPSASPLLINHDQVVAAVRGIKTAWSQARDSDASAMERRLHEQVVLAVAGGAPDALQSAQEALETFHLSFAR